MNTARAHGSSHTLPCKSKSSSKAYGNFSTKQVSIVKPALSEPKHAKRNMLLETSTNCQQGKKKHVIFCFLKHFFDFNN